MKKLFILLSIGGILTLTFNSCKKNHLENDNLQTLSGTAILDEETQYAEEGQPTVLGEQLPIPYTIANMTAAYESLMAEPRKEGNRSLNTVNIRGTHKYIKFKPTTEEQLEALLTSDLVVYDYPLDRQELIVGKFYRDPNVPDDQPTYQYATVRNGTTLPAGVDYEVLTEMYIPEEDIELLGTGNTNYKFVYTLVQRAENISGFTPWELAHNIPWGNLGEPGQWYPNPNVNPPGGGGAPVYGTIRIFDTRLNALIPFEGAKVTARRGARTRQGYTNANGQYGLDGLPFIHGTKVDFKLHMDREHYAVKDNNGSRANIKRNNIQSNHWSHDITVGYENMQGHMFRAAFRYFYLNIDGLKRPRTSGSTSLIAKNEADFAGHYNGFRDRIRVARLDGNNEAYDSDEYFGITIHELAHLSHKNVIDGGGLAFDDLPDLIPESWSIAVQWHLTNIEYRGRGIANYGAVDYFVPGLRRPHAYAFQYWQRNSDAINNQYTSLFINLVDNFNELGNNFPFRGAGVINDQVTGYTLATIETFMLHSVYGLGSLSTHLKANRPPGVTEAQIDQLLSQY
ncbi:MAG: hypothetical protein JNM21_13165 [Taibaiella sp.]|nr:hypothetical protein [Taibaiella sp.]